MDNKELCFKLIKELAYKLAGTTLYSGKLEDIYNSLAVRLFGSSNIETKLQDYESWSNSGKQCFITLITTGVTMFFREKTQFSFLKAYLENNKEPLAIWSAGCATGEEAYSILFTCLECLPDHCDTYILASDINTVSLAKAKTGVYMRSNLNDYAITELTKYAKSEKSIIQNDEKFTIWPYLKNRITFKEINLIDIPEDTPKQDIIFCRNVLMYLDPIQANKTLLQMHSVLNDKGLLFISMNEAILGLEDYYHCITTGIYQKK